MRYFHNEELRSSPRQEVDVHCHTDNIEDKQISYQSLAPPPLPATVCLGKIPRGRRTTRQQQPGHHLHIDDQHVHDSQQPPHQHQRHRLYTKHAMLSNDTAWPSVSNSTIAFEGNPDVRVSREKHSACGAPTCRKWKAQHKFATIRLNTVLTSGHEHVPTEPNRLAPRCSPLRPNFLHHHQRCSIAAGGRSKIDRTA